MSLNKNSFYFAFIIIGLALVLSNPVKALDRVILGQYPNYVSDELPVAEINYDKFTHLVYFSLSPYSSGNLNTNNVDTLDLQEFVTNAKANGIKAMIDVGGWGRSTYFSDMAADTVSRARFVTNIKQFCLDYNLDGVDLDWEPVSTEIDRNNYSLLIEELYNEFEPLGLILTVSVYAFGEEFTPEAINYLDWLNIMAYNDTTSLGEDYILIDFETDDHGWVAAGSGQGKFEIGVPIPFSPWEGECTTNCFGTGPSEDHSAVGVNAACTNLDGHMAPLDTLYTNSLTSPIYDFSGCSNVSLELWRFMEIEGDNYDFCYYQYKDSPTAQWKTFETYGDVEVDDDDWVQYTKTLSSIADGKSHFQLRFYCTTDHWYEGSGLCLDDVKISWSRATNHSTFDYAVASLDHWENYGVPREKEVLGVPFYGKKAHGRFYDYKYIIDTYHPDPSVDYVDGIGFNGIDTVQEKTKYVINNCYRGMMIWEISQDSFDETSLLNAIWEAFIPDLPPDFDGNGCVDFIDFSIFSLAWQSDHNDINWNPICDISKPRDNIINHNDLAVLLGYWQGCPYAADSLPDFNGDDHVDFIDFSILSLAWQSDPNDDNWNSLCDISMPSDEVIDHRDLAVLTDNWLKCLQYCEPSY
jgi:hypothetical protein